MPKMVVAFFLLIFVQTTAYAASEYCFDEAAQMYQVPATWLWVIAKLESDFDPNARNTNGGRSVDRGVMQISSCWKKKLGQDLWDSLDDVCTNIKVGAWILSDCLQRYGHTAEGIGCYNAVSKEKRIIYAQKFIAEFVKVEEGFYDQ